MAVKIRLKRITTLVAMAMVLFAMGATKIENMRCEYATAPLWVDTALVKLREIARLDALESTQRKRVECLEKELRSTSQRVNLFEKVKIPEAKENIRVIGVYLGDQQTAAVVRGKISKKKLTGAET